MQSQYTVGAYARPRTPGCRGNRFAVQSRRTVAWLGGIRLRQRRFSAIGLSACRATLSRMRPSPHTNTPARALATATHRERVGLFCRRSTVYDSPVCGFLILHDLHVLRGFFSTSPPLHGSPSLWLTAGSGFGADGGDLW